ncbi:hypothetical protein AMC82_PA00158 (plasmid) [Rhizobium phaseoli]|uniref:heme exporter protein CcmD n=1 Tax=Rhizobium phaseoli TaxID=396 RepID=UPI0007F07DC5|nr:heme exporter protein CcmD [Rhizobium phaseoli]ANL67989.1 hypothetical protein AMC84_PA00158 [Rhizobium phaseoli]ANL80803.1 hypothetical protein AMC82_PA00158 [Rhizobium phaseoli]
MNHLHYVIAAYGAAVGVMTIAALRICLSAQTLRRQISVLAEARRLHDRNTPSV